MKRITAIIIISVLLIGNALFGANYYLSKIEFEEFSAIRQSNKGVATVEKLFVGKILGATKEVSAEDRLKIEKAVEETGDAQIIEAWGKILNSATEQDAQNAAINFLKVLADKIIY